MQQKSCETDVARTLPDRVYSWTCWYSESAPVLTSEWDREHEKRILAHQRRADLGLPLFKSRT